MSAPAIGQPKYRLGTPFRGRFILRDRIWDLRVGHRTPKSRVAAHQKERPMANTSSAKKAARQMTRRTEVNKARRTRVKSEVRAVEEAIAGGDRKKAEAALKAAEPIMVRTAQKGMMHKKTASRKVSRLTQRVKAMSA
jgi:small subunit ribosomal protein S20